MKTISNLSSTKDIKRALPAFKDFITPLKENVAKELELDALI